MWATPAIRSWKSIQMGCPIGLALLSHLPTEVGKLLVCYWRPNEFRAPIVRIPARSAYPFGGLAIARPSMTS